MVRFMKRNKIIILQDKILNYRVPVYEALSDNFDIIVLHSGPQASSNKFKQVVLKTVKINNFVWALNLSNEINKLNPDAVIVMFDLHWVNYCLFSLKSSYKTILWGNRYNRKELLNKVKNVFLNRADAILQYSDADDEKFMHYHLDMNKVFKAWNTVKVSNHEDCSELKKTSILYVGRAQPRKKIDLLLRAYAEMGKEFKEIFSIDIIGAGAHNEVLMNLSSELGINEYVNFHGPVYSESELKHYFNKAVCYFSPGPVGLGLVHAQAYGVPVVTCNNEYHGPEFRSLTLANSIVYSDHSEIFDVLSSLNNNNVMKELGRKSYDTYLTKSNFSVMINGFTQAINYTLIGK